MKCPLRSGLTLIEVLLATAILAMALSALTQLQSVGSRASIQAELECEAVLLCQARLDELLAHGITRDLSARAPETALAAGPEPLLAAPGWSHRVLIQSIESGSLQSVTVEIYRDGLAQRTGAASQPVASLTRWSRSTSAAPVPGEPR